MALQDPMDADDAILRDVRGGVRPGAVSHAVAGVDDRPVLREFALYILLTLACVAMGLLIWIV